MKIMQLFHFNKRFILNKNITRKFSELKNYLIHFLITFLGPRPNSAVESLLGNDWSLSWVDNTFGVSNLRNYKDIFILSSIIRPGECCMTLGSLVNSTCGLWVCEKVFVQIVFSFVYYLLEDLEDCDYWLAKRLYWKLTPKSSLRARYNYLAYDDLIYTLVCRV